MSFFCDMQNYDQGWGKCYQSNRRRELITHIEIRPWYLGVSQNPNSITVSTNDDLSHKSTFGSQKKQWKRFEISQ
jgi:hypothetical protein